MVIISVPEEEKVIITGVKYNIQCKKCGNTWGVYLDAQGNKPRGWNVCIKCSVEADKKWKEFWENCTEVGS